MWWRWWWWLEWMQRKCRRVGGVRGLWLGWWVACDGQVVKSLGKGRMGGGLGYMYGSTRAGVWGFLSDGLQGREGQMGREGACVCADAGEPARICRSQKRLQPARAGAVRHCGLALTTLTTDPPGGQHFSFWLWLAWALRGE